MRICLSTESLWSMVKSKLFIQVWNKDRVLSPHLNRGKHRSIGIKVSSKNVMILAVTGCLASWIHGISQVRAACLSMIKMWASKREPGDSPVGRSCFWWFFRLLLVTTWKLWEKPWEVVDLEASCYSPAHLPLHQNESYCTYYVKIEKPHTWSTQVTPFNKKTCFLLNTSSSRASRWRKFQKKKELYSKERICL